MAGLVFLLVFWVLARAGIPGVAGVLGLPARPTNFWNRDFFRAYARFFLGCFPRLLEVFLCFWGVFLCFWGVFFLFARPNSLLFFFFFFFLFLFFRRHTTPQRRIPALVLAGACQRHGVGGYLLGTSCSLNDWPIGSWELNKHTTRTKVHCAFFGALLRHALHSATNDSSAASSHRRPDNRAPQMVLRRRAGGGGGGE